MDNTLLLNTILTIVVSFAASSGFWAYIMSKADKKNAQSKMILGLGHDRIVELCNTFIQKGYVTTDEYENLNKYLYEPYKNMGGNGSAQRLMEEVKRLPIRN